MASSCAPQRPPRSSSRSLARRLGRRIERALLVCSACVLGLGWSSPAVAADVSVEVLGGYATPVGHAQHVPSGVGAGLRGGHTDGSGVFVGAEVSIHAGATPEDARYGALLVELGYAWPLASPFVVRPYVGAGLAYSGGAAVRVCTVASGGCGSNATDWVFHPTGVLGTALVLQVRKNIHLGADLRVGATPQAQYARWPDAQGYRASRLILGVAPAGYLLIGADF